MSGFYPWLIEKVLFPLRERLGHRDTVRVFREMEDRQWWSRESLHDDQLARLRLFLGDVGAHVPYYRTLFAQTGFDPASVRSMSTFQRLPFFTADDWRANVDALRIEGNSRLMRAEKSAPNGEPLPFFVGAGRESHDIAAQWRALRWWDVKAGDTAFALWGPPLDACAPELLSGALGLLRARSFLAFELSDKQAERLVARLRKTRPKLLWGNPSALCYIGTFAEKLGVSLNDLGIHLALVVGERLRAQQRKTLSRLFGCPVAWGYGGVENGFAAFQCPSGSLHVGADVLIEIVDADGQPLPLGQQGEIVLTHLASRDFPFIRYRTGDIGTLDWDTCPCGRGLPSLKIAEEGENEPAPSADGNGG